MNRYFMTLSAGILTLGMFLGFTMTPAVVTAEEEGAAAAAAAPDSGVKKTSKKKKSKTSKKSAKATAEDAGTDAASDAKESADAEGTADVNADEKGASEKKSAKKTSQKSKKSAKKSSKKSADDAEDVKDADAEKKSDDAENADAVKADAEKAENTTEAAETAEETSADASALSEAGAKAGDTCKITVKGIEYTFCWCPAGTFQMGAPEDELGYSEVEKLHEVKLSKGFWMLQTEVTQEMFESVMGRNPSYFSVKGFGKDTGLVKGREETAKFPVDRVSYGDATDFCTKLSEICSTVFQLPTEAQWEYACRAGTTYAFYTDKAPTVQQANYKVGENIPESTDEVGRHGANLWGFQDMMGNVSEWCRDYYDAAYYASSAASDPQGPESAENSERVIRGGSFANMGYYCRSAARNHLTEAAKGNRFDGFRFVMVPGGDAAAENAESEENTEDAKTSEEVKDTENAENAEAETDAKAESGDAENEEKDDAEEKEEE